MGEAMQRFILCGILVCAMAVGLMGCGDKYGDAVDVNIQFANATEEYMNGLSKADAAPAVAAVTDAYAAKIEKIAPKIREIADKYPELQNNTEIPEDLEQSRRKVEEATAKMGGAMMNMIRFMGDPKVMEAQMRLQKAMALMAPAQE
jgi:Mg2+ and Co2+ transporter CorA